MSFADPMELFRTAAQRLAAEDYLGVAQCGDPVVLRQTQRYAIASFVDATKQRALTMKDFTRGDSNMPAEVAEYNLRQYERHSAEQRDVSAQYPGFDSVEDLASGDPAAVYAAQLDGRSSRRQIAREVAAGRLPAEMMSPSYLAEHLTRPIPQPLGVVERSDRIAHIVFTIPLANPASETETPEPAWTAAAREHLAALPADEQALHAEVMALGQLQVTSCRRQPDGGWLLLLDHAFPNTSFAYGWAYGEEMKEDEDVSSD